MTDSIEALEERIAHLQRNVDDLSDVVTAQGQEMDKLRARVDMLMRREANREQDAGGGSYFSDERPPHY